MQPIIYLLTIFVGLYIAYEDFRYRAVSWFWFPTFALIGFFVSLSAGVSKEEILANAFINSFIVLLQFCLLKVFFIVAQPQSSSLSSKLGIGDILLFIASCLFFSPINFVIFLVTSLAFTLAMHFLLVKKSFYSSGLVTVPLAGCQAIFIIFCVTLRIFFNLDLTDDFWIYNLYSI